MNDQMNETTQPEEYVLPPFLRRLWGKERGRTFRANVRARVKRVESPDKPAPVPQDHRMCPVCNVRIVQKLAQRCFGCAEKSADMVELTRLIREGQHTPRALSENVPGRKSLKAALASLDKGPVMPAFGPTTVRNRTRQSV